MMVRESGKDVVERDEAPWNLRGTHRPAHSLSCSRVPITQSTPMRPQGCVGHMKAWEGVDHMMIRKDGKPRGLQDFPVFLRLCSITYDTPMQPLPAPQWCGCTNRQHAAIQSTPK